MSASGLEVCSTAIGKLFWQNNTSHVITSFRTDSRNRVTAVAANFAGCLDFARHDRDIRSRTNYPLFAFDPLFAHDFCAAVCSWRAHRGRQWLAINPNSFASHRLHGLCAHRSHALQPARRLVARSTQPTYCIASLVNIKIVGPHVADSQLCCVFTGGIRN